MSKLLIFSDFNCSVLSRYLEKSVDTTQLIVEDLSMNNPFYSLTKFDPLKNKKLPIALIWSQPKEIFPTFNEALQLKKINVEQLKKEVEDFTKFIVKNKYKFSTILIPSIIHPFNDRGLGLTDSKNNFGLYTLLLKINFWMAELLFNESDIFILQTNNWVKGLNALNRKNWYYSKNPFSNEVFKIAANEIKEKFSILTSQTKKLVILDLDDTLWGGVVGDVGWENLRLGGHDPIGEAYSEIQMFFKKIRQKGIMLAICSKNEEKTVSEAFAKQSEMILHFDDFVTWRINWLDKAKNIFDIVNELNIGLDSVIFIDDSISERLRIQEALPEVDTPELPEDVTLRLDFLNKLIFFDTLQLTEEDRKRSDIFVNKRKLINNENLADFDLWIKSLNIKIEVEKIKLENYERSIQLLNKTNQLNLSTCRYSLNELLQCLKRDNFYFWTFKIVDRTGNFGITGLASMENISQKSYVRDFVISCRVFGKNLDNAMIYYLSKMSKSFNSKELVFEYLPTPKNLPTLHFLQESKLVPNDKNIFIHNTKKLYPLVDSIELIQS